MAMADGLSRLAEEIAGRGGGSRTLKRRAVSTAYYAVFHAIASLCANEILPRANKNSAESNESTGRWSMARSRANFKRRH